jgi:hypothetical protein
MITTHQKKSFQRNRKVIGAGLMAIWYVAQRVLFAGVSFFRSNEKPNHTTLLAVTALPTGIDSEFAESVVSWILQGCTKDEVWDAASEIYGIALHNVDLIKIVGWALQNNMLHVKDLAEHFGYLFVDLPSLSLPDISEVPRVPNVPNVPNVPSAPDVQPVSGFDIVINFVSEHKVALIVGTVAVVVSGIVIYVIWKRKGPTPPTETSMRVSEKSSKSSNKGSSVSKMIFVIMSLPLLDLYLNIYNAL